MTAQEVSFRVFVTKRYGIAAPQQQSKKYLYQTPHRDLSLLHE